MTYFPPWNATRPYATPTLSGYLHIDALVAAGPNWNDVRPARNEILFTFDVDHGTEAENEWIGGFRATFNADQQAACSEILAQLGALTGIAFVPTADGSAADLHFAAADVTASSGSRGLSSMKSTVIAAGADGDELALDAFVYLDNVEWQTENAVPLAGDWAWHTLLHELGHAMGLKHPFSGTTVLPDNLDNTANTLMSYTASDAPQAWYAPFDEAALLWLYGNDGVDAARGVGGSGMHLTGTTGADSLTGDRGNDWLDGGAGDDRLDGGAGDDWLDGGGGIDHLFLAGEHGQYDWAIVNDDSMMRVWAIGARNGSLGNDRLTRVERLIFADLHVALDMDGAAGWTARVLGAVFGAHAPADRPDLVGAGLAWLDAGMSPTQLLQRALEGRLGDRFQPEQVIDLLYANLLGAPPAPDDMAYWLGSLATGVYSPVGLAEMAAGLAVNASNIDLTGLQAHGLPFLPFDG